MADDIPWAVSKRTQAPGVRSVGSATGSPASQLREVKRMKAVSPLSSLGSVMATLATFSAPWLVLGCGQVDDGTPTDSTAQAESSLRDEGFDDNPRELRAQVVARGIPGAGAITQVGTFRPGGPFHDNPVLAAF